MGQWKTVIDRLAPVTASAVRYKIAALKHMGRVFSEHRQSALAEAAMRECLSLDPSQRDLAGQLVGLRLLQCEWPVVQPWDGVERAALMNGIMPLSVNSYTDDPLLQLACASRYVDQTTTLSTPSEVDRRHAAIEPGRRLRIGYLSSDLARPCRRLPHGRGLRAPRQGGRRGVRLLQRDAQH
jgi:predicted O-linked N-acetylglucosamine transferase (SPINDLY family)